MRNVLLLIVFAALVSLAACGRAPQSAAPIFAASLPDLQGRPQALSQWRGKVLVVNFWAPWCPPCRAEIPGFIKLQDKYRDRGLVFVGIALDDAANVRHFANTAGINYPLLLGDAEAAELSAKVGNAAAGLPYTAIIDRDGNIVATRMGGLDVQELETLLAPLLEKGA